MSTPKKRSYNSESRQLQAQKTRSFILEAAKKLFQAKGFEKVKIDEIAAKAGVSAPSVYALFQSKKGLLLALMDEAYSVAQFESLVDESNKEKSAKKRLALSARIARQVYDAEKENLEILRGASLVDNEIRELEKEREHRRYDRQMETVKSLFNEGKLKDSLSLKQARDILWTMTGRDLYRLLVLERGWSSEEYESWLGGLLAESLLR